ncbi:MAG TPA: hypothetical protein DCG30_02910 [Ruminococcus sp.]|nr:hypothetical protein [Ruminococcus sp.]
MSKKMMLCLTLTLAAAASSCTQSFNTEPSYEGAYTMEIYDSEKDRQVAEKTSSAETVVTEKTPDSAKIITSTNVTTVDGTTYTTEKNSSKDTQTTEKTSSAEITAANENIVVNEITVSDEITTSSDTPAEPETAYTLPDNVKPVTWKPSPENLTIQTDEAKQLYKRIVSGDYPTIEEIKNSSVTAQLDALALYYKKLYGDTSKINTPERKNMREEIKKEILSLGSAKADVESDSQEYTLDGKLAKEYKAEIILGMPASEMSSIVYPDSDKSDSFVLDCETVIELIPEFNESYGCAADALLSEGLNVTNSIMQEFIDGSMKGTNIIIPISANSFDKFMGKYIYPFEKAGYNVKVRFVKYDRVASIAESIRKSLDTGRITSSNILFSFSTELSKIQKKISVLKNTYGESYVFGETEQKEINAQTVTNSEEQNI